MLKKILKYDLENIFKFLIIFYSLAIVFAVFTRVFFSIDNSFIINILGQIATGATIAMIANILINNLMRAWVRFGQSLYKDESYLTHTLPVEKKTIYSSKIITAFTALLVSFIVIIITLIVAYYSKENIEFIEKLLLPIAKIYDSNIISFLLVIGLILFLEIVNMLQAGFTGIILGHRKNNNKNGFSIIFGLITYILTQIFVLLISFITALFNKDIMNLFITNDMINMNAFKSIILIAIIAYSLSIIICYFINIKLLKKGVNVD